MIENSANVTPGTRADGRPMDQLRPVKFQNGIAPYATGESREAGCAERCRLYHRSSFHRHAEQVGLKLHQEVVGGGAAVDAHLGQRLARVGVHGFDDVGHLVRDALERGTDDVRAAGRSGRQSGPRER